MSKETALAFLKHAADNAELQQKIVALAAQEGYEFTVAELTDAELEAAAGGTLAGNFLKIKTPGVGTGFDYDTGFKFNRPPRP